MVRAGSQRTSFKDFEEVGVRRPDLGIELLDLGIHDVGVEVCLFQGISKYFTHRERLYDTFAWDCPEFQGCDLIPSSVASFSAGRTRSGLRK